MDARLTMLRETSVIPSPRSSKATRPAKQEVEARALVMTAERIARALGGRKAGDAWVARCPSHDDRHPSLSIRSGIDKKVLVHCHAGCDQTWVVDALRAHGLWPDQARIQRRPIFSQRSMEAREEVRPMRAQSPRRLARRNAVELLVRPGSDADRWWQGTPAVPGGDQARC